jgi:predicted enzyme related to lactoylglutathione lyase
MSKSRSSVAVWFDLPATNFDRAVAFYGKLLGQPLKVEQFGPNTLAVFPYQDPSVSGAIMTGPGHVPSEAGTVLYLNVDGQLEAALERAVAAGGAVLVPVTQLPPGMGRFAQIRDSEGNRVGLHAIN